MGGERVSRIVGLVLGGVLCAVSVGCDSGASQRPTDPREILANGIRATASLSTLRLHAEFGTDMGRAGGQLGNGKMSVAFDADLDLAGRQLAGRTSVQIPAGLGGGPLGNQVTELIVTRDTSFQRQAQAPAGGGRWVKTAGGLGGGPTNAAIATAFLQLLADPANLVELRGSAACSLGTCDDIAVRVDGGAMGRTLMPVLGPPGAPVPTFDGEVLVDQATGVISEVRFAFATDGMQQTFLIQVSNPGAAVVIAPPPPDQVDDVDINFGSVGGQILETVGSPIPPESPPPEFLTPEPSSQP
jgi:hypothetical protein